MKKLTSDSFIPVEEGKRALDFLKKVKEDLKEVDFYEIKKHTDILVRCGVSAGIFEPFNHYIFRGVPISQDEVPSIKNKGRISYRKKGKNREIFPLNRASSNRYEIFYGGMTSPELSKQVGPYVTSLFEVDSLTDDDSEDNMDHYIAMGRWYGKEKFSVVAAGMYSQIAGNSQWAKNIIEYDQEICRQHKDGNFILEMLQFIGNEFGQDVPKGFDHLYKISSAYGDSLFDLGADSIIFPSVQTEGKSFNIAIRGEVVDACLDIDVAAIIRGRKKGKKVFWGFDLKCEDIGRNGEIKWEDTPYSAKVTGNQFDRLTR